MKTTIHLIAAARPNFMKIAPLYHALKREKWANPVIVHTGQHYDINMSDAFFKDLKLPEPDINLGVGSGSHAKQTGEVMMAYEKILMESCPAMVIVVGDVNSTIACALAASKVFYKDSLEGMRRPLIAHMEAGLRSFDRTMPEEINRLATDVLSDILWTPSPDADENLSREGIPQDKIIRVGNIMIDSLEMLRDKIENQDAYKEFGLKPKDYAVVTLHRPSNVDNPEVLRSLWNTLMQIGEKIPLVFPIHPRTRKNLDAAGLLPTADNKNGLLLLEPLNYIRFMNLIFHCRFALTDSGGIQEETTYLGIPCLTLRENTERPITISEGTNRLCKLENVLNNVTALLQGNLRKVQVPDFWDGKTAGRVVSSIKTFCGKHE